MAILFRRDNARHGRSTQYYRVDLVSHWGGLWDCQWNARGEWPQDKTTIMYFVSHSGKIECSNFWKFSLSKWPPHWRGRERWPGDRPTIPALWKQESRVVDLMFSWDCVSQRHYSAKTPYIQPSVRRPWQISKESSGRFRSALILTLSTILPHSGNQRAGLS